MSSRVSSYLLESSSMQQKLAPKALSYFTPNQATQIEELLQEFSDVSSAQLGRITVTEHTIDVGTTPPIRQHPYGVPLAIRNTVGKEVDQMLELGVI